MIICKSHLLDLASSWDCSSSVILKMEKAKEQHIHLKGTGHSQTINLPLKRRIRTIDMLSEASEAPRFPSTPQKPQNVQPQISSKKGTTVFMFCPPSGSTVCVEKIDCALMGSTMCKRKKEMNRKISETSQWRKTRGHNKLWESNLSFHFLFQTIFAWVKAPRELLKQEDMYV